MFSSCLAVVSGSDPEGSAQPAALCLLTVADPGPDRIKKMDPLHGGLWFQPPG